MKLNICLYFQILMIALLSLPLVLQHKFLINISTTTFGSTNTFDHERMRHVKAINRNKLSWTVINCYFFIGFNISISKDAQFSIKNKEDYNEMFINIL